MSFRLLYYLKKSFDTLKFRDEELDGFQERMLKEVIEEGEKTDLYSDIEGQISKRRLEDYPVTKSEDVRSQISISKDSDKSGLERESSGSTGNSVRIEFSRQAHEWLSAINFRTLLLQGYKPFKDICQLWEDMSSQRSFLGKFVMPKNYVDPNLELEEQIDILNSFQPDVLQYFPMTLLAICKKIRREDIDCFSPELVVTYGEIMTPKVQEYIEDTLDTEVVDQYNTTEFGVVAWQCSEDVYHIAEDAVYPEIIRSDKFRNSNVGQLVLTGLVNSQTPLVRYGIGDLVELTDKECGCKTGFTKIKRIRGRKKNVLQNSFGDYVFPDEIVDTLGPYEDLLCFQLEIEGNKILLNYVPNSDFSEEVLDVAKKRLEDDLGLEIVETKEKNSIEKTSGGKLPVVKNT